MAKSRVHQRVTKTTISSYRKKGNNQYRCPTCGAYRKKG